MEEKKQIIFLEPWPTIMVYKMARMLRQKGYYTVSIRILESDKSSDKFYQDAFDEIISFNLAFFKIEVKNISKISWSLIKKTKSMFKAMSQISKLRPYIIFAKAVPSWPCALTKILFKKYPLVYLAYDVRSSKASSKKIYKEVHKIPEFEFKAEKFCFEKSDGILYTGGPGQLDYLNEETFGKDFKVRNLKLNFYSYCLKDFLVPLNKNKFSKKDKKIHTVYIGSVGSVGLRADNYLFDQFKSIINQKIHVHIYAASNTASKTSFIDSGTSKGKDLLQSKYFHIHPPLGPREIIKEISKYDFGLLLSSDPTPKNCPIFSVGNKISSYMEAGIPCIYDEDQSVSINRLMKKYNLYLPFRQKNFREYLEKINYPLLEKRIIKAREDFLMEKQFPRLKTFIEKVRKKHNNSYKGKGEISL